MPTTQKARTIEQAREWYSKSSGVVFADYRGLKVTEVQQLRNDLRKKGAELHVLKNTLFRIAAGDDTAKMPAELHNGTTAFAERVSRKLGRPVTADEAIELVRSERGPLAAELYATTVYVSVAMAAVVNLFNPKTVFVHARLFDADDTLFERVVELTKARALPPSVADCALLRAKGTKPQGAVAGIVQQLTDAVADHVQSM